MSADIEEYDGYWYCPDTMKIYPRYDGQAAPEANCFPQEPVIQTEDGNTSGLITGISRPELRPAASRLPSTGAGTEALTGASALLVLIGTLALLFGRRRPATL